ncbi:T-complex protein 1 subunit delta [Microbotryomycetes sp. JL221]|nr:T-complex protein 1 subunit delta [Microbotryomycetes sp. JL221]
MAAPAAPAAAPAASTSGSSGPNKRSFQNTEKPMEVRLSNMTAAKAVADAVRTSLGPRGMDKMIQTSSGEVVITNDGATILKHMSVMHPAAKMLVDLSAAQDIEAGDGTTSVVVLAGSLLGAAEKLLAKGIHPTVIAESFGHAATKVVEYLTDVSTPVNLSDRESLLRAASTSLSSKIVSQYSSILAPIAVDSVLRLVSPSSTNVDLRDIRLVKKVGGTIDDTELMDGVLLNQNVITSAGGPTRIEKAKIGIIQFQLSPPKPDMDNQIVVNDYRQMDKILKEERLYILNMCKAIKKSGCNVLLIQKSILRDAVNELSLAYLQKLKILAVRDVERDEIEFLSRALGCKPISDVEQMTSDKLGEADLVEETEKNGAKFVKISGIKNPSGKTVSVLCTGANSLVLEESERSLHDALCVVRCLVKKRALIAGGGAPEINASRLLAQHAQTLKGMEAYCFSAYAEALEVIPTTLAENAGLNPIAMVTELRNRHASGERTAGINVRKGVISNILDENVLQPLLVSTSAIELATETVGLLLRIDDPPLPAWHTKNIRFLEYELPTKRIVTIEQNDAGADSTAHTVWLGSQLLSVVIAELHKSSYTTFKTTSGSVGRRRKVAIDVGSGTGLLAMTLTSLGYNVIATDIKPVANGLLRSNLDRNFSSRTTASTELAASVCEARTLDWFEAPSEWDFDRWSISSPSVTSLAKGQDSPPQPCIHPPFDLITTSDSIYDLSLVEPLIKTLTALAKLSLANGIKPSIYVALEDRDPLVTKMFFEKLLSRASDGTDDSTTSVQTHHWTASRIPHATIQKLAETKLNWGDESDYDGVQVWKLAIKLRTHR